ncbi:uncharacterized protein LOC126235165 [Schistocerca nitens]|uniref:uncharacterized protein LOC126235165 n=1 Tax=Schistocerca nitens TaxID=7011 RepID=UPI0021181EAC|nr:uncharacterized protein LOC126235165 [Schistocerca nitens]
MRGQAATRDGGVRLHAAGRRLKPRPAPRGGSRLPYVRAERARVATVTFRTVSITADNKGVRSDACPRLDLLPGSRAVQPPPPPPDLGKLCQAGGAFCRPRRVARRSSCRRDSAVASPRLASPRHSHSPRPLLLAATPLCALQQSLLVAEVRRVATSRRASSAAVAAAAAAAGAGPVRAAMRRLGAHPAAHPGVRWRSRPVPYSGSR